MDPLAQLNHLQDKDLELDRIREEQGLIPNELSAAREDFKALEHQLADLQDRLRDVRVVYHRADLELQDLKGKYDRAKQAQMGAGSAKEQTQYGEQMRQLEDRIEELEGNEKKKIEGEIMPLMEQMDKLEGEIEGVRAKVEAARPKLEEMEAANRDRITRLEAAYQEKKLERDSLAAGIPANIVREYESIRRARRGTGLTKMAKTASGYRCTACNVQLPMHVAQQVFAGNKIVRCPSCGRILWKGE
jgi:predicted  nucleic acid-binding Zn-ribbon protein